MAWADMPASETTDWSAADFLNQFVKAINERAVAVGESAPLPAVAAGDDVSAATYIAGLQSTILTICTNYRNVASMGYTPGTPPATLASTSFGSNFTAATLMAAAGLTDGFTRKRPREIATVGDAGEDGQVARLIGGGIYEHDGDDWLLAEDQTLTPDTIEPGGAFPRYVQAGDYIGPWIWNDLKTVLGLLYVWFQGGNFTSSSPHYNTTHTTYSGASYDNLPNLADAKAAAEADWPTGGYTSTSADGFSIASGTGGSGYNAELRATTTRFDSTVTVPGGYAYNVSADLFFHATKNSGTFNSFGLGYVDYAVGNVRSLGGSGPFETGDSITVGTLDQPTWPASTGNLQWVTYNAFGGTNTTSLVMIFAWEYA